MAPDETVTGTLIDRNSLGVLANVRISYLWLHEDNSEEGRMVANYWSLAFGYGVTREVGILVLYFTYEKG